MKIGARQRWLVLGGLLSLTLSAAAWVRDADRTGVAEPRVAEIKQAPARVARRATDEHPAGTPAVERLNLEKMRSREFGSTAGDPFSVRSWRKPAPVRPLVAVPPPAPSAPPLPYAYMGKLLSEEQSAVFLTQGERNLIVHEGDTIDAIYRVEKLSGAELIVTHLPTGIRQTLSLGDPQ